MNDRRIRRLLGWLACFSLAFVFYASAVPLRYQPVSLAETWARFQQIPWLQLGLENRADWVANGLILVPFGFFFIGSIHARRPRSASLNAGWVLVSFVLFAVLHGLIVCAIEFMQIWFPPRVLSQNDMLAGYIGGLLGAILWHLVGDRAVDMVDRFYRSPRGLSRIWILMQCCAIAMVLYKLMPLDVMLTTLEWNLKADHGRINWIPFADWHGPVEALKSVVLRAWAIPLGVVLGLRFKRQPAVGRMIVWCAVIELVSLPIYHRHTTVTNILVSCILGCIAIALANATRRLLVQFDIASVWLSAAIAWTMTLMAGFTARYQAIVTDPELWRERLSGIFVIPFARAHRSTEFEAGSNILIKLMVFGLLAFLLSGWCNRAAGSRQGLAGRPTRWRVWLSVAWVVLIGLAVEFAQTFLIPLVPDVTDLLLYGVGAILGAYGFRLLIPERSETTG